MSYAIYFNKVYPATEGIVSTTPPPAYSGFYTIEFNFSLDDVSSQCGLGTQNGIIISLIRSGYTAAVGSTYYARGFTTNLSTNTMYHFVFMLRSTDTAYWIYNMSGTVLQSGAVTSLTSTLFNGTDLFKCGNVSGVHPSSGIQSWMQDIRIWSGNLDTSSVIPQWIGKYVNPNHPNFNNLILNYKTDEGSGTIVHNSSQYTIDAQFLSSPNDPVWTNGATISNSQDLVTLVSPTNGRNDLPQNITFTWSTQISQAVTYSWQISENINFSQLLYSGSTSSTSILQGVFFPYLIYYWRVKQQYSWWMSSWSQIYQFSILPIKSFYVQNREQSFITSDRQQLFIVSN